MFNNINWSLIYAHIYLRPTVQGQYMLYEIQSSMQASYTAGRVRPKKINCANNTK